MLTITECEKILISAIKAAACKGNLDAAKKYFYAQDTE
jgi:hypothetical protein